MLEQRCFLGERLLRDSDAAGMAPSLEIRLPLVDSHPRRARRPDADRPALRPVGRKAALRRAGLVGLDPALFERPEARLRAAAGALDPQRRSAPRSTPRCATVGSPSAVGLDGPAVERLWDAFRAGAPGLYWSRDLVDLRADPMVPRPRRPPADTPDPRPIRPPMSRPRLCLITPCRDEAAYARRTLDSVLGQTRPPDLWVIVDDGSTDETPDDPRRIRPGTPAASGSSGGPTAASARSAPG